jgi:hypothetical protein
MVEESTRCKLKFLQEDNIALGYAIVRIIAFGQGRGKGEHPQMVMDHCNNWKRFQVYKYFIGGVMNFSKVNYPTRQ